MYINTFSYNKQAQLAEIAKTRLRCLKQDPNCVKLLKCLFFFQQLCCNGRKCLRLSKNIVIMLLLIDIDIFLQILFEKTYPYLWVIQ